MMGMCEEKKAEEKSASMKLALIMLFCVACSGLLLDACGVVGFIQCLVSQTLRILACM